MTDSETTRMPTPGDPGGNGTPPEPGRGSAQPGLPPPPEAPPPPQAPGPPPPPQAPEPPPPAQARAWQPPPSDSGRNASLILGVIVLVIGAWFFATNTLGLDLPDFDWGQLWPLILIALGAWIVLGALRRRSD